MLIQNKSTKQVSKLPLLKVSDSLKRRVIKIADTTDGKFDFLITAYDCQIKKLDKEDAREPLQTEIVFVAMNYGMRQAPLPMIIAECAALVHEKFSYLSIKEIKEAYRGWASGEFEAKGGEMYGGQFNAAQLGKVLNGYSKRRNEIMKVLTLEMHKEQDLIAEKNKEKKAVKDFEEGFGAMLIDAKSNFKDWRDVPHHWYEMLEKREIINPTKERRLEVWKDSEGLAKLEIQNRIENEMNAFKKYTEKDLLATRKTIARKLYVFRFFIKE